MENTHCGDQCPFVKSGFCSEVTKCPNYMESWWTEQGGTVPKLVKDCSPKRLMLQQQYMQLRLEQLQASADVARSEYINVAQQFKHMLDVTEKLLTNACKPQLEQKNETLTLPSSARDVDQLRTL